MYAFTMKKNRRLKHRHENYKFDQSHLLYYQQGAAPLRVTARDEQLSHT